MIHTLLLGVLVLPQSASHPLSDLSRLGLLTWLAAAFGACTSKQLVRRELRKMQDGRGIPLWLPCLRSRCSLRGPSQPGIRKSQTPLGCAASRVLFEGAWFSSGEPRPCVCFAAGACFWRLLGLQLLSLSVRLFPPLPGLRLQPFQL